MGFMSYLINTVIVCAAILVIFTFCASMWNLSVSIFNKFKKGEK